MDNDLSFPAAAGRIAAAVAGAFIVYSLIVGLEGTGRHFLEIAVVRVALLGALIGFARWSGSRSRRLGRVGVGLAVVTTVGYLGGAVGAIVTDGWSFDVLGADVVDPPWYLYVLGLAGMLFALATLLVGIAGRASGAVGKLVIVAGVAFPFVWALGPTAGHVFWMSLWLAAAVGLTRAALSAQAATADMRVHS